MGKIGPVIEPRTESAVVLRPATSADTAAVARVAQRDTQPVPPRPHLVAERDGRVEAAISLQTRELVANPFAPTADLCALLRLRAAELARAGAPTGRRRGLRARPLGATA